MSSLFCGLWHSLGKKQLENTKHYGSVFLFYRLIILKVFRNAYVECKATRVYVGLCTVIFTIVSYFYSVRLVLQLVKTSCALDFTANSLFSYCSYQVAPP